jgi:hypothetical protein
MSDIIGVEACGFFATTVFLAAGRRFFAFAALLPAALNFRVRAVFFVANLRFVGMGDSFRHLYTSFQSVHPLTLQRFDFQLIICTTFYVIGTSGFIAAGWTGIF